MQTTFLNLEINSWTQLLNARHLNQIFSIDYIDKLFFTIKRPSSLKSYFYYTSSFLKEYDTTKKFEIEPLNTFGLFLFVVFPHIFLLNCSLYVKPLFYKVEHTKLCLQSCSIWLAITTTCIFLP